MKKVILALSFFFCSFAMASPINQLVFFGDSLSDDGNLYQILFQIVPKSPPYFNGRFTNGPTWSEFVGKYYYDKYYIPYRIYAVGGATAIFHPPTTSFITTTTIDIEINFYLLESLLKDKSRALYSIWIGGNDYIFDLTSNVHTLTTQVVNKISSGVKTLISRGAKTFLVMNLPDLSSLPYARINGNAERLHELTVMHNDKLLDEVKTLRIQFPEAQIIFADVYSIFNEFLSDPDGFNKKYNTHITNTTGSCWQGGYLLKTFSAREINEELKQALLERHGSVPKDVDMNMLSSVIANSPEVRESYNIGATYARGGSPCRHPDEYIFWDQIHPTEVVNKVLSIIMVKQLTEELPQTLFEI